jgi:hypothetical protein
VAGCDATARFFVSVEADFSNSQAKAGATATVRSMAAAIRRVIFALPVEFRFDPVLADHPCGSAAREHCAARDPTQALLLASAQHFGPRGSNSCSYDFQSPQNPSWPDPGDRLPKPTLQHSVQYATMHCSTDRLSEPNPTTRGISLCVAGLDGELAALDHCVRE